MAVRTPTDIYVGVDSRETEFFSDGSFIYHVRCKIGQVGKIFFTGAGPYRYAASGLDIGLSLRDAQRPGATVSQTVERFEDLYTNALLRTLSFLPKQNPKVYEKIHDKDVHVFLFAFENEIPQSFNRTFTPEVLPGSINVHIEQRNCPPDCTEEPVIYAIGAADAMKNENYLRDRSKTRSPIQFINETIEASIKAHDEQSDGPVDLLHINKDGAKWVQRKKECPDIVPYQR